MNNIFVEFLPPWVETGIQPAFYDKESGTVLQQTARMYARVNMLIRMFNKLSKETKETVEEYITKFNDLHDYVHDYFDNLDVQEEINNKLDQMVTDGTLGEIIEPYITAFEAEIREQVSTIGDVNDLETVNKNTVVAGVNCANENYSGLWRTKYGNGFNPVDIYQNIDFFKDNIVIYKDENNNNYSYYCDLEKHKNIGDTLIVDPNTDTPTSEQNGSAEHPYSTIGRAYNNASDGDTISLTSGVYNRNQTGQFAWTKSLNLIAKDGEPNKVFLGAHDNLSWSQNATYSNVYETTRSNIALVIDIRNRNKDEFALLTQVENLETCASTLYSFAKSGSTVYVNLGEAVTNDKIAVTLQITSQFRISNSGSNVNVYMENITFLGGDEGFVSVTESGSYDCKFVAKNCNFYYSRSNSDALSIAGSDTILENCKACFGGKDGFNYGAVGTIPTRAIEINCLGSNNGLRRQTGTENGSTSHAYCKVLRYGGVYFNNFGANVCDVGTDNMSINIECTSFDSVASAGSVKSDFNAQQANTTMYIYNCHCKGSKSSYNLQSATGCTLEVYNTPYDTKGGNGTINIY